MQQYTLVATKKKIVKALPSGLKKRLPKDIAIVPVNERKSAELNRRYRGKNRPTNVLSFRYGPEYGEILLCPAVIRREAKASGNSYRCQMLWMILHGTIHLAGLHHEKSAQARKKFENLEQKLFQKITNN
ncbi:MAG: rRNA maturation RNase YbeY [Candidatus Sungiibacteriota bacterium]